MKVKGKNTWRAKEALEEHGKELVKSNAFAEKELKSIPLDKQKEIFYNPAAEITGEIKNYLIVLIFNTW